MYQLKATLFIYLFLFCNFSVCLLAQKQDSIKVQEPLKATANLNITNNGISLFPNLSLEKPAAIINVSVGKKNVFFEPELRWGLNGKPWSYIYWLRYKYRKSEKFGVNLGTHPSYVMREATFDINGKPEIRIITTRYLAGEIIPTFYFSKKFVLSVHYLYAIGLDAYAVPSSQFASIQPKFPHIDISKGYYLSFFPQIFHLSLGDNSGFYFNESLFLAKKDYPISISSIFTYKIKSTIPGNNIVWNVGLNVKL